MKIFIDRLQNGQVEKIEKTLPGDFLEIRESELAFPYPITVQGEAYLVESHLYMNLHAHTSAQMPCQICNCITTFPVIVRDFIHIAALLELKLPIYDYSSVVREALLLQIPPFIECIKNGCPERQFINQYLNTHPNCSNFPFSQL